MNGWMDERLMDEGINGWMDGWMNEWIDRQKNYWKNK